MCLRTTSTIVRTRVHRRRTPTWQIALRTKGRGRHFIPDKSIVVGNPLTNEACSGTDRSIRCTHRSFEMTIIRCNNSLFYSITSAAVPHSFLLLFYSTTSAAVPHSFLLLFYSITPAAVPHSSCFFPTFWFCCS